MCDENSEHFKKLFKSAGVEESRFIRTTDADHRDSVHAFWETLKENGHIIKGSH